MQWHQREVVSRQHVSGDSVCISCLAHTGKDHFALILSALTSLAVLIWITTSKRDGQEKALTCSLSERHQQAALKLIL
jgi:hypothetical protein